MSSDRQIKANQANGCKSRGPQTRAGKERSSQNAYRHGLSLPASKNPAVSIPAREIANAICGPNAHPELFASAVRIAESYLLLCSARRQRLAAVERLREGEAGPYGRGSFRQFKTEANALMRELDQIDSELITLRRLVVDMRAKGIDPEKQPVTEEMMTRWSPPRPKPPRDEFAAMKTGEADIKRFMRYEIRAWSRLKTATRQFLEVEALLASNN